MTDGDVDMEANPGGLPASDSESSTLNLRDDELEQLIQQMQQFSKTIPSKDDTVDSWQMFLCTVLVVLTSKLASSTEKNKVIGPLTYQEAEDMVLGFNEEQLNKWKEATWRGVEKNEWTELINLRTCLSECPLVCSCLRNVTAKLKNPKLPNVAQGVPIELRVFFRPIASAYDTILTFYSSLIMV